jgi:hypothetical protein
LCELTFPVVGLKISSLPTFALKSPNKIFMSHLWNWSNTRSNLPSNQSFTSLLLSSQGVCIFRIIILHLQPLNIIYIILLLTNSTLLTADMILLCMKKPIPNSWLSFSSSERNV